MKTVESSLANQHYSWLLEPVNKAVTEINNQPFYDWLRSVQKPEELRPIGLQIFHHSLTLPRAIGMMLTRTPYKRSELYQVYSQHAFEEADHHLLLLDWMMKHHLISDQSEAFSLVPTIETRNCINMAYEIALDGDHDLWLCVINTTIESCAHEFFKVASSSTHRIGCSHKYFDVHVEADAEHSVMGLRYLSPEVDSRKDDVVRHCLDAASRWSDMLHSWIK